MRQGKKVKLRLQSKANKELADRILCNLLHF